MSSWNVDAINHEVSNAAPVDLNVREDFPVEKIEELIREYAAGNVGSNLVTVTMADPDTYALAPPSRSAMSWSASAWAGGPSSSAPCSPHTTTSTGDVRTSYRRTSLRFGGDAADGGGGGAGGDSKASNSPEARSRREGS